MEFFSHGKLLISGEYLVLLGAEAFALPTKLGQSMQLVDGERGVLSWEALDHTGRSWFNASFDLSTLAIQSSTDQARAQALRGILSKARSLNPEFLAEGAGYRVVNSLQFPNDWGLGSSSTLICNIAKWSETDAFALSEASFGGSGVDIAVGMVGSELLYSRPPAWDSFVYNPPFKDQLLFVHLGQKQNSRDEIKKFREERVEESSIVRVSEISRELSTCDDLDRFGALLDEHESILSGILERKTVKQERFADYPYSIKSLGAWGGDFVLAIGDEQSEAWFRSMGYDTIVPYSEMIKK